MKFSSKFFAIILAVILQNGCALHPTKSEFKSCHFDGQVLKPSDSKNNIYSAIKNLTQDLDGRQQDICLSGEYTNFRNFDALVLSGGGPGGAFGSGFISQLIEKNKLSVVGKDDIPHPCLITGVSTGAVMAPFVYLATSLNPKFRDEYTDKLYNLYSEFDDENLLKKRNLIGVLLNNSFYDVSGIKETINKLLTPQLIQDINQEYESTHRLLLIGATEYYSGEFEVFNLTNLISAAAKSQTNKDRLCAAESIRASSAIPVAFEPVPILDNGKYKLYEDGGVRHMVFLNLKVFDEIGSNRTKRLFGVINSTGEYTHYDDQKARKGVSILNVALRSAALGENQLYLDSAYLTDQAAASVGTVTKWVNAKSNINDKNKCELPNGKMFDPQYQRCLMKRGVDKANSDKPWDLDITLTPTDITE